MQTRVKKPHRGPNKPKVLIVGRFAEIAGDIDRDRLYIWIGKLRIYKYKLADSRKYNLIKTWPGPILCLGPEAADDAAGQGRKFASMPMPLAGTPDVEDSAFVSLYRKLWMWSTKPVFEKDARIKVEK